MFFRADDVAVPGDQLDELIKLFMHYRVPLCLAVVPAWLTKTRWEYLKKLSRKNPSLLCWHHHGWRHINHEPAGKKQEFGPSRSLSKLRNDFLRGQNRLEQLMGKEFYPVFTPPWNRCDYRTLELLKAFGYHAVSRSRHSNPSPPDGLPDIQVNVDLHTRKENNAVESWKNLFSELDQALSNGLCGIMIHHRRMNSASFIFLELFMQSLSKRKEIQLVHFKDLINEISRLKNNLAY